MLVHPEIEEILNNAGPENFIPTQYMLRSAGKLLNYIDDINAERAGKFELTAADSLYLQWDLEDLEFYFECLANGKILYTFRKGGLGKASGSSKIEEFIPMLESFLLISIN
ncbi:MAG: hypothetical protein M3O71_17105 [Bacteroidota bacterium]|nr:hypothetical protein [Bacteroidota bacterium]